MRPIRFKGYSILEKQWVYGYYFKSRAGNHFITGHRFKANIDPESVRQFTGLIDSLGREIFEGDTVIYNGHSANITWDKASASYLLKWDDGNNISREHQLYATYADGDIYRCDHLTLIP